MVKLFAKNFTTEQCNREHWFRSDEMRRLKRLFCGGQVAVLKYFIFRNIFLIDGVGALCSALILGIVLPYFEIGISNIILVTLSLIALSFSVYSIGCFVFKKNRRWLKSIITANLLYCIVTTLIAGSFYEYLSDLGITYFVVEIMLIVALVFLELRVLKQSI